MRKLGVLNSLLYAVNILVAFLLLCSFILPYLSPQKVGWIALLSIAVSPLILCNVLFFVYWCLRLRKQAILSGLILLASWLLFHSFFKFSSTSEIETNNTLSVLSYNVRLFNAYEPKSDLLEIEEFKQLVGSEKPDVIFIQEYYKEKPITIEGYPFSYVHYKRDNIKLGHAIFSKYPLLNKGAFDFNYSYNNILFADIVKANDTLRLYNLHLQSLGIKPEVDLIQSEKREIIFNRVSSAFKKQERQMLTLLEHAAKNKYKTVLGGDFNNTAYSYVYQKLAQHYQDGFQEKGSGLGTTFWVKHYPMRIDYLMASKEVDVLSFKTFTSTFSDHNPIFMRVGW